MGFIGESLRAAFFLIFSADREVFAAVWTSVSVAGWSVLLAGTMGVPLGIGVALGQFRLKRAVLVALNSLMAMPTVVIGLLVYGVISRQGPLGGWGWLFTPKAIVIGQTVLAIPIVANYTLSAVKGADYRIVPTALTLGAGSMQSMIQLTREVRFGIMAAIIAGFGRVISEVGAAMMLGGNIRGYTRTMTTAIALETSKGEFGFGLALGIILMGVSVLINVLLTSMQESNRL
jgi:tungstate transport system permease protein